MTDKETMVQGGLVTIEELRVLDISRASAHRRIDNGTLPTVKLIGARRIPRRALIAGASRVSRGTVPIVTDDAVQNA